MAKRILAALLCTVMLVSFSGCSPAETVGGWLDNLGALIPNDIELIISQLLGTGNGESDHEIYFSTGYANMLKNGTYNITYVLSDDTEVIYGSNGVRTGTSYPESVESTNSEPQYDENGNEIVSDVPREHIVLFEGTYYYIDDAQSKMFTVNPDNYKAVPFEISTEGMKLSSTGNESFGGKDCRFERYTTNDGDITFYFDNTVIYGLKVEQGQTVSIENITAFNKYLNHSLVSMPDSYTIVEYWTP